MEFQHVVFDPPIEFIIKDINGQLVDQEYINYSQSIIDQVCEIEDQFFDIEMGF